MKVTSSDLRFLEYRLAARWRRLLPKARPFWNMPTAPELARRALMDAINARGELPGHGQAGNAVQLLRLARSNLQRAGSTSAAGREVRTLEEYMRAIYQDTGDTRARLYRRWLRRLAYSRRGAAQ